MESRKSVRLLVVHDQEQIGAELQTVAEMNSHVYDLEFELRTSGAAALELMASWRPSIVLLDAHIHDMNSIEFLRQCKEGGVPVILTSSHNSIEIELSAKKNGAIGYCPIGRDPEMIEQVLSEIVMFSEDYTYHH